MLNKLQKNKLLYLFFVLILLLISISLVYFSLTSREPPTPDNTYEQPQTGSNLDLPQTPSDDWTTYQNNEYGIAFAHPKNWGKPQEVAQSTRRMLMFNDQLFIAKGKYYDDEKDGYINLLQYVEKIAGQLSSSDDINIGQYLGKKVVFKNINGKADKALYLAKNENDTELLTITFFDSTASEDDNVFDQIVSGLKLGDPVISSLSNTGREKEGCVIAGCYNEVCIDPTKSTGFLPCIYQPVFSCFVQANCAKNEEGGCGWLQTEELKSCIDRNR